MVLDPLVASVIVPLLAAALTFVVGPRLRAPIVLGAAAILGAAALGLARSVLEAGPREQAIGGWAPPLGIVLRADGLSAFLVVLTAVVAIPIVVYALAYLRVQREPARDLGAFWPLFFFAWLGLNALYLTRDLFNAYVALEVLGLASVALVALGGPGALVAAIRYVLVTLLGSMLFLLGVALLYAEHGVLDLAALGERVADGPSTWVALAAMTLGLALKTALFPFHFWLPPAHARALAPVSALLSALVVEATFYLIARLALTVFPAVLRLSLADVLGALGALAILWGGAQALRQTHLKGLVAYSTVAQIGYLFLVFPLAMHRPAGAAAWTGAFYFLAAHGCAKAAMFLAAGTLERTLGDGRIDALRGAATRAPLATFALALSGVTLVGLPPSGGFLGKWMLLSAALETGRWPIALVNVGGSLLAMGYVFGPLGRALLEPSPSADPPRREPLALTLPALGLALVGVLLGLASDVPLRLLAVGRPFVLGAAP